MTHHQLSILHSTCLSHRHHNTSLSLLFPSIFCYTVFNLPHCLSVVVTPPLAPCTVMHPSVFVCVCVRQSQRRRVTMADGPLFFLEWLFNYLCVETVGDQREREGVGRERCKMRKDVEKGVARMLCLCDSIDIFGLFSLLLVCRYVCLCLICQLYFSVNCLI